MKKKYLLLIDDDPDEFDFFQDALRKIPDFFDCGYAASANLAFKLLESKKPDFIFIDMNMPMVNGLECITIMKTKNLVPDVPLFIYSTSAEPTLVKKAEECGATGCLKKSPDAAVLAKTLQTLYHDGTLAKREGMRG